MSSIHWWTCLWSGQALVPAQHQHCHHRLTGVGWRPATCTNLSGCYPKLPRSFQTGACLLQMERGLCGKVHLQEGQTGIHTTVCLWHECSQNWTHTLRRRFSTLPDSISLWRLNSELLCILHVLINMIIKCSSVPWPQMHLTGINLIRASPITTITYLVLLPLLYCRCN